jgi:hypothetical protein
MSIEASTIPFELFYLELCLAEFKLICSIDEVDLFLWLALPINDETT